MLDTIPRVMLLVLFLTPGCGRYGEILAPVASPGGTCTSEGAVTLRFAWPARVSASVAGVDVTERWTDPLRQGGVGVRRRAESQQQLSLMSEAVGAERRLAFADVGAPGRLRLQGLAPALEGRRPAVFVGADGRATRVDGLREMSQAYDAAHRAGRPHGSRRDLRQSAMLGTAQAHWDWILGEWNGQTLRCGQEVRRPRRVLVPSLAIGLRSMYVSVRQTYVGDTPCDGGGARCVHLRVIQRARDSSLREAFMPPARSGTGYRPVVPTGGQLYRVIDVRVAPDTLLPYWIRVVERSAVAWSNLPENPRRYTTYVFDRQEYTFAYR